MRFLIEHDGDPEYSLVTRSSDGQMLFLANLVSKMKHSTKLGSRIAEVHNGSSLFTGDAGQGESSIRRWIIESDWLEAIVALPLNMFYNTGIATYVWVVTNRKPEHRKAKVQLIDATAWYKPLRKNLGKKNCELSGEDIDRIVETFLDFKETEQSKIFDNAAFGYWKVTVERPLRLRVELSPQRRQAFRVVCIDEDEKPLADLIDALAEATGAATYTNFNAFMDTVEGAAEAKRVKLNAKGKRLLVTSLAQRDAVAEPVIKKEHKNGKPDALYGLNEVSVNGKKCVVEYEADIELRDTEQIPLQVPGGVERFIQGEVLQYAPDAWVDKSKTEIGYEISFNRYFYKPQPLRSLDEIKRDIVALERETEGLLKEIVGASV
jgi:type I restriction enzyme M protein